MKVLNPFENADLFGQYGFTPVPPPTTAINWANRSHTVFRIARRNKMKPRFTTRTIFVFMFAVACGCAVASLQGLQLAGFIRGVLGALIGIGLMEQIVSRENLAGESRWSNVARKAILSLLVVALLISVARMYFPYHVPKAGRDEVATITSKLAPRMFDTVLFFGMLTSHWMTSRFQSRRAPRASRFFLALNSLSLASGIVAFVVMAPIWVMILALVDIAVQGIHLGRAQSGTTGTPNFLFEVTRPDVLFRRFANLQLWSWPLLLVALVIATWRSQIRSTSRRMTIAWFVIALLLSVPSLICLAWFLDGGGQRLFPELLECIKPETIPDRSLAILVCFLIVIYLTTRRSSCESLAGRENAPHETTMFSNDSFWIGPAMIALGGTVLVSTLVMTFRMTLTFALPDGDLFQILQFFIEAMLTEPDFHFSLMQVCFGVNWLWRRYMYASESAPRWPQPQSQHLLWGPVIALLFAALFTLLPWFGISVWHTGLGF